MAVPLTKNVHNALMALGMAIADIPDLHRSVTEKFWQRRSSKGRQDVYFLQDVASYMLHGLWLDFEKASMESQKELERAQKVLESLELPQSSPESSQRARSMAKAIFGKHIPLEAVGSFYYRYLSNEVRDSLGSCVQDLDRSNELWSQFFATGISKNEAVDLFTTVFMAGMKVRCPVQEFPSQWSVFGNTRTLDELEVIGLSAAIREKPEWRRKLQDEGIVSKWREEAYAQDVTPSMFDFMLAELHWLAGQIDPETGIDHATVPGVFFSESLISTYDRDALRSGTNALTEIPEKEWDWHPGSNQQVLDLVHPSLYPYVRGRTPRYLQDPPELSSVMEDQHTSSNNNMEATAASVLRFFQPPPPKRHWTSPVAALSAMGSGVPTSRDMPDADLVERKWYNESNYQWLPVDAQVSPGPDHSVRFLSYINNLHPTLEPEASLYPILEKIFARFVPMFERTLTETRLRRTGNDGVRTEFLNGPTQDHENYWNLTPPNLSNLRVNDINDVYEEYVDTRRFVRPTVGPFVAPDPTRPAHVTLGGKTLQVIIKMANVHLTPEKPEYGGGSWHVEGTDNEKIVATGIYYFDAENIEESSLGFRQAVDEPMHRQDEYAHFEHLYGIDGDVQSTNQPLGTVTTPEGRCICFPNGMQHRLSPFKLIDATKPGHRKILVFFLVDPSQRILSTSDVPPQQLEWHLHEIRMQTGTRLSDLPIELLNMICEHVRVQSMHSNDGPSSKWLMTVSEAHEHRLKLMGERAAFAQDVSDSLYERGYSLCEH